MLKRMRVALGAGLVWCSRPAKSDLRPPVFPPALLIAICLLVAFPVRGDLRGACRQYLALLAIPEHERQEWEQVTLLAFEASGGDAASVEALVNWVHQRAPRVLPRTNDVEDIAQIASVKILEKLPKFCRQGGNFKKWATHFLLNVAMNYRSSRRFQAWTLLDPAGPEIAEPLTRPLENEQLPAQFQQAIRKYFATRLSSRGFLPNERNTRRAQRLFNYRLLSDFLRGIPTATLSKVHGLTEYGVQSRIHREREALFIALQESGLILETEQRTFSEKLRRFFSDPAVHEDAQMSGVVRESIQEEFLIPTESCTTLHFWEAVFSLRRPQLNAIRLSTLGMPLDQIARSEGISLDEERELLAEARTKVSVHLRTFDWIQRELPSGQEFVMFSDYFAALSTLTPRQRTVLQKRMLGKRHDQRSFRAIQKRLFHRLSLQKHRTNHFLKTWIPFADSVENRGKLWDEIAKLDPITREIITLRLHGTGAYDIGRLLGKSRKEIDSILAAARLALIRTFFPSLKARGNAWLRKYFLHRYPNTFTPRQLLALAKRRLTPERHLIFELKYQGFMNQAIAEMVGYTHGDEVHSELRLIHDTLHTAIAAKLARPAPCPYRDGTPGKRLWDFVLSDFPDRTLEDFWEVAKENLSSIQYRFLRMLSHGFSHARILSLLELPDYQLLANSTRRRLVRALLPKRNAGQAWMDGVIACVDGGTRKAFWKALKLCPQHYQEAVTLRVKKGMTNPEICTAMKIEYSQLQGILYNAKIKILELMAGRRTRPRTTILNRLN